MLSTIGSFYFVITGRNIVFNQYRRDLGFIPFNFIDYNLISYFLVLIISFLIFIFCYRGLLEVNRIIFCKELDKDNKTDVEIVKKDYIEKVKDKELLKKIITGLDIKKYADFINILDMEGTSKTSEGTSKKSGSGASVSGGDWGIISSILLTGGKKKGKRKFTKKQRKQRKNRTR